MKKLTLMIVVMFTAIFSFGQAVTEAPAVKTVKPAAAKPKQVANAAAYACQKCFAISKGEGNCEKCNVAKVQLGTYYCPMCSKGTGAKPGKCPSCSMATTQMTRKYCAKQLAKKATPAAEKVVETKM